MPPQPYDISLLLRELAFHRSSTEFLSKTESQRLCGYYRNYSTSDYLSYLYIQNLRDVINRLTPNTVLLDAACGYGTEAIIFALLGASVIGIDLNENRLKIARSRVDYYRAQVNKDLSIKFLPKDAIKFLQKEAFDIVWTTNAISHIYPVENFLTTTWYNLKPQGKIIIRDANKHNPHVFRIASQAHRRRGRVIHRSDPESGETVLMGVENVFSIKEMINLLKKANFHIESINRYGFFPNLRIGALSHIDKLLSTVPLINRISIFYSIVGEKRDEN